MQTEQYLRLTITSASTVVDIVCWHLQLYGCIDSQGKVCVFIHMYHKLPLPAAPTIVSTLAPYPLVMPTPFLVPEEKEKEVKKDIKAVGAHYLAVLAVTVSVTIFILVVVCVVNMAAGVRRKRICSTCNTHAYRLLEQPPQAVQSQLNLADLPVLLEELNDVRTEWYNIGMQLLVHVNTLDCIQEQRNNPTDCLRKALKSWLENCSTPTWRDIVNVLRSRTVNKTRLAAELNNKYCCEEIVSMDNVG